MNEQQLKLFISQAFALANREAKVVAALEPQLLASMKRVQDLVASLPPPGDLFRERAWRELQPRILDALGPYNQQFLNQLQTQLAEEAPQMAAEAVKMLEASGASVPAAQVRTTEAVGRGFPGLNVQDSVRVALESKVNNQRVVDLFSATPDSPVSAWMRTNQDVINKVVTRGILEGQSTEDIAKGIISTTTRNGEEYVNTQGPTATRRVLAEERAIARTAVQDANRQVNEEVFRANEEQLSGLQWEWVAALDSKTCPTCAPLDGQRWDNRSDAPTWPIHINCRCRVVAVDPEEAADVRAGLQVSPTRDDLPAGREYKTKLKVKGSKLYRVSTDIKGKDGKPPTYADFLAQSNRTTQQMFFGGGNAGSVRAQRFADLVKRGFSPEKALQTLITGDPAKRGFVPVDKLPPLSKRAASIQKKTVTPKPKVTPAPKKPTLEATKQFAQEHQFHNGNLKISPQQIADSLGNLAKEEGLAGRNMRQLLEFQQKGNISVAWSTGREKLQDFGHWKAPGMVSSLQDAAKRGTGAAKIAADMAKDLERGDTPIWLAKVGRVRGNAAGHAIDGGGVVVLKQESQFVPITGDALKVVRKAAASSVKAAEKGRPSFTVLDDLYKPSGKTGYKTKEGWVGTYIHEMGHQVHFLAGKPSLNDYLPAELRKRAAGSGADAIAALDELRKLRWNPTKYGTTNELERFAETFTQYVLAPDELLKANPTAYRWVEDAIKKTLR